MTASLLKEVTIPKGQVRRLAKAIWVRGGQLDIEFSGDWLVSVIGDQALLAAGEDFSVTRGFWVTDGFEPCTLFRNADVAKPFVPELRDETDRLPRPGTESAGGRHAVPMPVERPDAADPRLAWLKTAKMERLLDNSVSMAEFDRPGALDDYIDRQLAGKQVQVFMLSGMHSRHTYLGHRDRGIEAIRRICATAHRRGIKVIDHHDSTLLWNIGSGFRVMMERLSETARSRDSGLPSWQLCPSNPQFCETYYAYLRQLVEAGVDGFQIDELEYWSLGCVCQHCRDAFRRDTGWEVPLNELDADFNNPQSLWRRVWHDWRKKAVTNWFVELRRRVKALRPDLVLSVYTTNDGFCYPNQNRYHSSDMQDLGRVMNWFGSEMMTRSALRNGRNLLPIARMRVAVAPAGSAPLWTWWYNVDYPNEYFAWGISTLAGRIPLLSGVAIPPSGAHFESFGASDAAMRREGAEPVAEVALLFPTYSRDWNVGKFDDYRKELFGTAQELDAMHIPYRFISDDQLASAQLTGFKALFVGEAQCLSDAEIAAVKSFAERGGKVRMTSRAGTRDELGSLRSVPGFSEKHPNLIVTEQLQGAPFELGENWSSLKWDFAPDPEAEAKFRLALLEWCGAARSWQIEAPGQVLTAVWREASGAYVVHLLNGTGVRMKVGDPVLSEAPEPAFPPLSADIVITAPAAAGERAVALSPDFPGEIPLETRRLANGSISVTLPKALLSAYTLVRISGRYGKITQSE